MRQRERGGGGCSGRLLDRGSDLMKSVDTVYTVAALSMAFGIWADTPHVGM
jgi:hypothetical protein